MTAEPSIAPGPTSSTVVVVVNYKTPTLVTALLESMRASSSPPLGVVVVDNASGDGSGETIERWVRDHALEGRVRVERLPKNVGFAGGNNAGVRVARATWPEVRAFFLLNPDTLVERDTFAELEALLARESRAGIVGSQIESPSGEVESSGHVGDGPAWQLVGAARVGLVDRWLRSSYRRVVAPPRACRCDWVSGAAMMIREAALRAAGPMDDRFFLYFEEVDLCRRVRRAGWQVWLAPASRVVHFEGSSTGISRGRRPAYWFASRRRFFLKHRGLAGLLAADAAWAIGRCVRFAADRLTRRPPASFPPRFGRDLLLGDLAAVLSGRVDGL